MNKTRVEVWLPMVETTEANVSQQWDTLCIITKYVRSHVMDTVNVSLEASLVENNMQLVLRCSHSVVSVSWYPSS